MHHYSRYTDKGSSIAERVIRTIRNLFKKPVFEKGSADWLSELLSIVKKYNNTIHNSTKMTPNQASKRKNEKVVFDNLQDEREIQKPKFQLEIRFVQLISNECSAKEMQQTIVINYTQKLKSYMTLFLAIESIIYPRIVMKIYYYQQN